MLSPGNFANPYEAIGAFFGFFVLLRFSAKLPHSPKRTKTPRILSPDITTNNLRKLCPEPVSSLPRSIQDSSKQSSKWRQRRIALRRRVFSGIPVLQRPLSSRATPVATWIDSKSDRALLQSCCSCLLDGSEQTFLLLSSNFVSNAPA